MARQWNFSIRKFVLAVTLALGLAASPALAVKALVSGRLVNGNGGPPLANSIILVDGERITAVGTTATLPVPVGADIIGVRGDVLDNIDLLQNVPLVMKGGKLYKQNGEVIEAALK